MLLKNKIAVITGCNRGIGKKILDVFMKMELLFCLCKKTRQSIFKQYKKYLSSEFK